LSKVAPDRIRVMTWNIHGALGRNPRFDLDRVVALVRRHAPDIIALQEIDSRRAREAGTGNPFDVLQQALGAYGIGAKTVTTADGDSVFEGVVAAASGSGAGASAAPARASFTSAPGRVLVQMVIEDASARLLDRDVRDLVVTRFVDPLVIGTPEVRRARTARDLQRMAADDAPVAISRQFSRTESLVVRVPVSGASGTPTVTARLVSQPGTVLRSFEPVPVDTRPGYFEVQLPLAWLAIGNYALEFSASSGTARAGERVAFRVTP